MSPLLNSSRSIRAVYMRGGASKALFLHEGDLPGRSEARDRLLLRLMGSPDPSERQIDGMGGGALNTSKVVLVRASKRADCDVEFMMGEVALNLAQINYGAHGGDLIPAVGAFALQEALVKPEDGITRVRIWMRSQQQRVDALIPVQHGSVLEVGQFQEDGASFKSAEVQIEFFEPESFEEHPSLLPTSQAINELKVPGLGQCRVTMICAPNPFVFLRADTIGLTGKETPESFNRMHTKLKVLETIRAQASVAMGLASSPPLSSLHLPSSPVLAWVAMPQAYRSSAGIDVGAEQIDVLARMLSIGKLQSGMSGAGAIALAAASALPGSVVNEITRTLPGVATRIGHVSGTLAVGAELSLRAGVWRMDRALLSGSARRLMSGQVYWPDDGLY